MILYIQRKVKPTGPIKTNFSQGHYKLNPLGGDRTSAQKAAWGKEEFCYEILRRDDGSRPLYEMLEKMES
jgi:hypothetical protein